jgi:mycothiol synthase
MNAHAVPPVPPPIADITFHLWRGLEELPGMLAALLAAAAHDNIQRYDTLDALTTTYTHLDNCDPATDLLIAEREGATIAYVRCYWIRETSGHLQLNLISFLAPPARDTGCQRAMLRWGEERLRAIAAGLPAGGEPAFYVWADDTQQELHAVLAAEAYQAIRYGNLLTRPAITSATHPLPVAPLPAGIELRSPTPADYRRIWEAETEAFLDHWGARQPTENDYAIWLHTDTFQPRYWTVAWDLATGEVAGSILGYIDAEENRAEGYLRGWNENISVRRPWRRRGLARAMLVHNIGLMAAAGMTEVALCVDVDNPNGAFALYTSLGFARVRYTVGYQKKL